MARKVFYSFHYHPDNWRVSTVRSIGAIEGNQMLSDNDWEEVTDGGNAAIERWIANQMAGRSCAIVLIGSNTAGRKWIDYEIEQAWAKGMGVVGVHIHNLKDRYSNQSAKGSNPFAHYTIGNRQMIDIVKTYDPPYVDSQSAYRYIADNIENWVEEAIRIRNNV